MNTLIYIQFSIAYDPLKFLLFLIYLNSIPAITYGDTGWLQVCDPSQKFALTPAECGLGIWLPTQLFVSCVCVHGVWILSTGLCDKEAVLLVGGGDCFAISKAVNSIKYLGDQVDPFAPSAFIVAKDFSSFVRVPTNGFNPSLGNRQSSMLLTINPKRAFMRYSGDLCLASQNKTMYKPVHIWMNKRMEPDQFRRVDHNKCPITTYFDHEVDFGEVFREGIVLPVDETFSNCSKYCPITPSNTLLKRVTTPPPKKVTPPPKYQPNFGRSAFRGRAAYPFMMRGRLAAQPRPSPYRNLGISRNSYRKPAPGRAAVVPVVVSPEQGVPMGNRWKNPASGPPPAIRWDGLYGTQNRLVFINGAFLPPGEKKRREEIYLKRKNLTLATMSHARETREQTVRMIEAHTNFYLMGLHPPKVNTREYEYMERVRQIFSSVVPDDLLPVQFVTALMRMFRLIIWESHEDFQHRESPSDRTYDRILDMLDTCLLNISMAPMFLVSYNVTSQFGHNTHGCLDLTTDVFWSPPNGGDGKFLKGPQRIPPELEFDYRRYDVAIELAWKMYMFTLYHCSEFFERQAEVAHEFAAKIQALFNYKIIKRWYQPEDFHLAVKVIFPKLDLDIATMVVDRLVAASWFQSPWKHAWLSRPPLMATEEDTPQMRAIRVKRSRNSARNAHKPTTKPKIQRLWEDTAICMEQFTDPVERFGFVTPPNCYAAAALPN